MDRNDHFKYPVSKTEVPDYYDVVKTPMCWSVIDTKLDQHRYWNLKEFRVRCVLASHFLRPCSYSYSYSIPF